MVGDGAVLKLSEGLHVTSLMAGDGGLLKVEIERAAPACPPPCTSMQAVEVQ